MQKSNSENTDGTAERRKIKQVRQYHNKTIDLLNEEKKTLAYFHEMLYRNDAKDEKLDRKYCESCSYIYILMR